MLSYFLIYFFHKGRQTHIEIYYNPIFTSLKINKTDNKFTSKNKSFMWTIFLVTKRELGLSVEQCLQMN